MTAATGPPMPSVTRECRRSMAHARDYQTWYEAAQELDRYEGQETWREDEVSADYDYRLIRERLQQLRRMRQNDDIPQLVYYLRQGMHWNLGNVSNDLLYGHSRIGTKYLIQDYLDTLVSTLNYLCDTDFPSLSLEEKNKFFQDVALSFGRSALVLSGGATMGFFHLGVIKALHQQKLLPRVVSGSSAGALVAAGLGSIREEEIDTYYTAESIDRRFWKALSLTSAIRRGVIMDQNQLRQCISHLVKDVTFSDSYEISQRIINITVSPARSNQIPRLLNYLTFPHLYVREAVLASCAVPFVFPPVMLMTREPDGKKVPFMPTQKWVDGSMKSDLPILRLRRLHNVNHTIVSQTNPLVLPFMQMKGAGRDTIKDNASEFVMSTVRYQTRAITHFGSRNLPFEKLRRRFDDVHALLEQDYRGHITILPRFRLVNYLRLAANPTLKEIEDYILEGERSTWPHIATIRNQTVISQTLDSCLDRLHARSNGVHDRRRPRLRVVR
jgi:NTE family protein